MKQSFEWGLYDSPEGVVRARLLFSVHIAVQGGGIVLQQYGLRKKFTSSVPLVEEREKIEALKPLGHNGNHLVCLSFEGFYQRVRTGSLSEKYLLHEVRKEEDGIVVELVEDENRRHIHRCLLQDLFSIFCFSAVRDGQIVWTEEQTISRRSYPIPPTQLDLFLDSPPPTMNYE